MSTITIEVGQDQQAPYQCSCCENWTHSSYGFVYSDNNAHATYFANWVAEHSDKDVTFIISLGEWGNDDVDPMTRKAVALRAWSKDNEIVFSVLDATNTRWAQVSAIGRKLTRQEALADRDIGEYFHIAEHVVHDDGAIHGHVQP
jgi:hypothetical protein